MTGCFLDTTIVVDVAGKLTGSPKSKAEKHIDTNKPAATPYYALRELLTGYLRTVCETHNVILASTDPGEALIAILKRSPAEGRKKIGKIQELAHALQNAYTTNAGAPRDEVMREMLGSIALRASQLWLRSHKMSGVNLVQPLGCFNSGDLTYGSNGELRGPGDSFNCIVSERCAAAAYLYDEKITLEKMIQALHPDNLNPIAAQKQENAQRRKALKELQAKGPKNFSKTQCRALGDAYFAAMCPPGSEVITTNVTDFEPLCQALAKVCKSP